MRGFVVKWSAAVLNLLALTGDDDTPLEKRKSANIPDQEDTAQPETGSVSRRCYSCGIGSSWPNMEGPDVALSPHENNRWYCHQCGPQQDQLPLHQIGIANWPMWLRAKMAFPSQRVIDWIRRRRRVDNIGKPGFNIDLPAYECRFCGGWHKALPDDRPPCLQTHDNRE